MGTIQHPIQWVPQFLPEEKQPGHNADHSLPSTAEVKNARNYTFAPMAWKGTPLLSPSLPQVLKLMLLGHNVSKYRSLQVEPDKGIYKSFKCECRFT
jgi:hypothetical protein